MMSNKIEIDTNSLNGLLKKISGLSDQHKASEIDSNTLKSFAKIVLDTIKTEAAFNYKHFTNAATGNCKKFDARNCKSNLGVMGTISEFQIFNKSGLVLATDDSGWKFELTPLGATIVRLALALDLTK